MIVLDKDLCLSGGAIGADLEFGRNALNAKHGLIHWSFESHKVTAQKDNVVVIPESELQKADEHLLLVKSFVKRSYPCKSEFTNNLLRRNYFQARDAGSCYAVSSIKDNQVDGGTAWATARFIAKYNFNACPVYVFCQIIEKWHEWNGSLWVVIEDVPKPKDIYAGIGSRKLSIAGKEAIGAVYD